MSRQVDKGTRWETLCRDELAARLGDERIHRKAHAGAHDTGDLGGIFAHGYEGVAECKWYKTYTRSDMLRWRAETLAERANANADFAVLLVHEPNKGLKRFADNTAWMTINDLHKVAGIEAKTVWHGVGDMWVATTIGELCDMIVGVM